MERLGVSQVTPAEAREIRGGFRDLFVTLRDVFGPPELELRRRDEDTGVFETRATFVPVAIRLPNREERVAGANAGMVTATTSATLTVEASLDIQRDDRTEIDGRTAVVTDVAPEVNSLGYRTVDVRLEG